LRSTGKTPPTIATLALLTLVHNNTSVSAVRSPAPLGKRRRSSAIVGAAFLGVIFGMVLLARIVFSYLRFCSELPFCLEVTLDVSIV